MHQAEDCYEHGHKESSCIWRLEVWDIVTHLHYKSLVFEKQVHHVCLWDTMKKGSMVYVCSDYDTELIRAMIFLRKNYCKGQHE